MTIDEQALRAAAEAIESRQWVARFDDDRVWWVDEGSGSGVAECFGANDEKHATYIAAANPQAVLALLDQLHHYRETVDLIVSLADAATIAKVRCRDSNDCPCSFKDCYECGKWHDCHHSTSVSVDQLNGVIYRQTGEPS